MNFLPSLRPVALVALAAAFCSCSTPANRRELYNTTAANGVWHDYQRDHEGDVPTTPVMADNASPTRTGRGAHQPPGAPPADTAPGGLPPAPTTPSGAPPAPVAVPPPPAVPEPVPAAPAPAATTGADSTVPGTSAPTTTTTTDASVPAPAPPQ